MFVSEGTPSLSPSLGGHAPFGFDAGSANLYEFVGNGPTDATDPSGMVGEPPYPAQRQPGDAPGPDQLKVKIHAFQSVAKALQSSAKPFDRLQPASWVRWEEVQRALDKNLLNGGYSREQLKLLESDLDLILAALDDIQQIEQDATQRMVDKRRDEAARVWQSTLAKIEEVQSKATAGRWDPAREIAILKNTAQDQMALLGKPSAAWTPEERQRAVVNEATEAEREYISAISKLIESTGDGWAKQGARNTTDMQVNLELGAYYLAEQQLRERQERQGLVHTILDIAGFLPIIGSGADALNSALYAQEGDTTMAAISAAGAIPLIGNIGKVGKRLSRFARLANDTEKVATRLTEAARVIERIDPALRDAGKAVVKVINLEKAGKDVAVAGKEAAAAVEKSRKAVEEAKAALKSALETKASLGTAGVREQKAILEAERGLKEAETLVEVMELRIAARSARTITTRAKDVKFVEKAAQDAERLVIEQKLAGSLEKAQRAAKEGKEIIPGLFIYQQTPTIPGYAQHHLWPQAMGGPREGWVVYAKQEHATLEGIQGRLNTFLRGKTDLPQRELESWGRENPDKLLPLLREFYKGEKIPFPY
jgi:hypothetical protein